MWTFVPAQAYVGKFLETFKEFPPVQGGSLGIDKVVQALQSRPQN
jgi:arylsulfatase